MAAARRPEKAIKDWAKQLSGVDSDEKGLSGIGSDEKGLSGIDSDEQVRRWKNVFEEHPEFFLVYQRKDELKAALRWRYTNKLYDPENEIDYTPKQIKDRPELKSVVTSRPLESDAIDTLINTAIELHSRAIEAQSAKRWWLQLIPAGLGFLGALAGAIIAARWGVQKTG
jgi:hypothetical protein